MGYNLKDAAALLEIAPSTLHEWSRQFAVLLSDSARQESATRRGAPQRRYTEANIATLHQAKTLLRSGRTYEQVRRELARDQLDIQHNDRVDLSAAAPGLAIPQNTAHVPITIPAAVEQAIEEENQTRATLQRTMPAPRSVIDQLREDLTWQQTSYQELLEHESQWRASPTRSVYQSRLAMCGIGLLMSVLVAIGIVLVREPSSFDSIKESYVVPPASPIQTATNSSEQKEQQTALSLLPLTGTTQEPALTTMGLVPTTSPSSATAVLAEVAGTEVPSRTSQVASSHLSLTPTAPVSSPARRGRVPTTGPASAEASLLEVAEAEAALRMGQLEATITYGSGARASARVRFDLGDEQRVPRFQITTTYKGTTSIQTTEQITIGDQAWQRQQDGQWTVMPARESALKQLQVFLPRTDSIADTTRVTVEGMYVLRWYDAARDADVTLRVDAAGIPQQLRRVSHANGLVLTVTYSGWNIPVEITPPI